MTTHELKKYVAETNKRLREEKAGFSISLRVGKSIIGVSVRRPGKKQTTIEHTTNTQIAFLTIKDYVESKGF